MKKTLLTVCFALMSVFAYAQKGQVAAGLNLSYGTEISNIGIGAKGQYNFTDAIRGEVSFDYFFEKDYLSMWDINVNAHYLFNVAKGLKVYPLVGLTYTNWKADTGGAVKDAWGELGEILGYDDEDDGGSSTEGKIGANLGAGVQYDINGKWAVNFEVKYQLISDFNQAVFGLGVAYKF